MSPHKRSYTPGLDLTWFLLAIVTVVYFFRVLMAPGRLDVFIFLLLLFTTLRPFLCFKGRG